MISQLRPQLRQLLDHIPRARLRRAVSYSVLNKLFDIAPEILIGAAIDVVVNRDDSFLAALGIVDPMYQLLLLGVLTFWIWAFESLFQYLYEIQWRTIAQDLQHSLRIQSFAHAQQLPMGYFEDESTGNLVAILNDDINQLERFVNSGANELLQTATAVVAVGAVFLWISPILFLLAILPIPIILWGAFYFQRRIGPRYAEVRQRAGAVSSMLANAIAGIATIKSFTAEEAQSALLANVSKAYGEANQNAIRLSSAFVPLIRIAVLTGFLCTLVVGGYYTISGTLNVGAYGVLVFLTQRLLWPLTRLGETVDLFERAMASAGRVFSLNAKPIEINIGRQSPGRVTGGISYQEVEFAYPTRASTISDLTLDIAPGTTVGIVGATGAGKSTFVKLLLRLYEPQNGTIRIDGIDIRQFELRALRQAIGYVSQDVFLFEGTIAENVSFGSPTATVEEIVDAAKAAEAHEFIESLPDGYQTIVGERGQKLSGGQRQRISIARAILKNPPILIFDEATSAVDTETEASIKRSLLTISKNRTVLLIAHRLSTVVHADIIFVLSNGRLVETGTFAELLTRGDVFSTLWEIQSGNSLPPALVASG